MITIASWPKRFTEPRFADIQTKAIKSWQMLSPDVEIILVGKDEGVAEVCAQMGLKHLPNVRANERGTIYLDDLLYQISLHARHNIVAYVNADIIVLPALARAVSEVSKKWKRFLLVSAPHIADFTAIQVEPGFEKNALKHIVQQPTPYGADIFVHTKGLYKKVKPFLVGRQIWDSWMMAYPAGKGIPCIDATEYAITLHPIDETSTHAYVHLQEGKKREESWRKANDPLKVQEYEYNESMVTSWWFMHLHRTKLPYEIKPDGNISERNLSDKDIDIIRKIRSEDRKSFIKSLIKRVGLYNKVYDLYRIIKRNY
ncbi:MAG: hypothetical protein RML92_00305 [Bacteroidia bacterium]|nr:hypothetical protein [Bacteroidia bacterium]